MADTHVRYFSVALQDSNVSQSLVYTQGVSHKFYVVTTKRPIQWILEAVSPKGGCGLWMKLITHLYLIQRLRMNGVGPILPCMPPLLTQGLYQRIALHGKYARHYIWRKFRSLRKKSVSTRLPWRRKQHVAPESWYLYRAYQSSRHYIPEEWKVL